MLADEPVRAARRCDSARLRAAAEAAADWLRAHAAEVDALNVYPVPDGDTGSNMDQTLRAAVAEGAGQAGPDAGAYAARLAHGALMGARGNSGVILSQLLRGFARALADRRTFTPAELAAALGEASATAYRGVLKPVEGTVLTVSRAAAEGAARAAGERAEFAQVLEGALDAGRRALAETRHQLPALRQAGVVDAGGRGYVLILEGALRHLRGEPTAAAEGAGAPPGDRASAAEHARFAQGDRGRYGYCTEFLIAGEQLDEASVRAALAAFGDSLLVVGEPELLRVHVHTDDPGGALAYATTLGRVRRVKVEDMQAQHEAFAAEVAPPAADAPEDAAGPATLPIGVVAAAAGAGFARIYASLGARVVPGGQTMNPSTEQFLRAIEACPQRTVIVLPNNRNVVPTARQAAALAAKEVHVVPTETVPQGIGALLAVRYDEDPARIAAAMGEAAAHTRTAEITTAARDAEVGGLRVRRGDILGLLDGTLVAAGADAASVAGDLLERMPATAYEIATIYRGEAADAADAAALAALIRRRYPALALEEAEGGQPHYQFVLSLE